MEKSKLYTSTGDRGATSLVGGQRVPKHCLRLEAYGTVDELSAFIGVALSHRGCPAEIKEALTEVQCRLFDLGSYLATEPGGEPFLYGFSEEDTRSLESRIDRLDAETPKANAFVLSGGTEESAHLHVARTVCRRAERALLRLDDTQKVDPRVLVYFNRLSDYLFIAARYANFRAGVEEIKWHPREK